MARTVLVFGTFDGLHAGHRTFLKNARAQGDRLVVSVARDAHVRLLKNHNPQLTETQRLEVVRSIPGVNEVRLSDSALGSYKILNEVEPDLIVLGHDQQALETDLRRWSQGTKKNVEIQRLPKYETTD